MQDTPRDGSLSILPADAGSDAAGQVVDQDEGEAIIDEGSRVGWIVQDLT
jgi:hypothetical protein